MKLTNKINGLNGLVREYGDSFYVLDVDKFRSNYDNFKNAFLMYYPKVNIGYSYKTNYTPALCEVVNERGGYAEVVSEMEYDLAIKIGVAPSSIIVNGPYKTIRQLEKFVENGSVLHIDSETELYNIVQIMESSPSVKCKIALRCNFDIENEVVSRFGLDVEDPKFFDGFHKLQSYANAEIVGLHCHFPDRNLESYKKRIKKMICLVDKLFKVPPKYIDVGGGYFGQLDDSLKQHFGEPPTYQDYAAVIGQELRNYYKNKSEAEWPELILEPGSALVADTMSFYCKVIDIKSIRGQSIAMTSGSKFNLGSFASTLNMPMQVHSNKDEGIEYTNLNVSGFTCIEADYLYRGYDGKLSVSDILEFMNIGSYSIVFKPPFIMPNVPVLKVDENMNVKSVLKRQETMEDVFSTFNFYKD